MPLTFEGISLNSPLAVIWPTVGDPRSIVSVLIAIMGGSRFELRYLLIRMGVQGAQLAVDLTQPSVIDDAWAG